MKFNNIVLLVIAMILFQIINTATSETIDTPKEEMAYRKEIAQRFIPYYKNLKTCTPYDKDDIAKIYGKKNNQCHFRLNRYDCKTPIAISWQYGKTGYELLKTMQDEKQHLEYIEKHKKYYKQMEKNIIQTYCKHINKN